MHFQSICLASEFRCAMRRRWLLRCASALVAAPLRRPCKKRYVLQVQSDCMQQSCKKLLRRIHLLSLSCNSMHQRFVPAWENARVRFLTEKLRLCYCPQECFAGSCGQSLGHQHQQDCESFGGQCGPCRHVFAEALLGAGLFACAASCSLPVSDLADPASLASSLKLVHLLAQQMFSSWERSCRACISWCAS